jgi:hypothetical protein
VGLKGTTFVLVYRRLADMARELSNIYCQNYDQKERLVDDVERGITEQYLNDMDTTKPSHTIVAALVQVWMARTRLPIQYRRSEGSRAERQKSVKAISTKFWVLTYCVGSS